MLSVTDEQRAFDRLRAETRAALAAMTSAEARRDQAGCLLAAAAVRQSYINSLGRV